MSHTTFQQGQLVRALVTAQGLTAGTIYTVQTVREEHAAFGAFVTYYVQETPSHRALGVVNDHLLLRGSRGGGRMIGCPCCSGLGGLLGYLGRLAWWRCRSCGMEFSSLRQEVTHAEA